MRRRRQFLHFETGGKDAARTRTQGCVRYVAQASQPAGSRGFPAPCFSRRAKPGASTLAACRNIPCTPAVSLLKLFPSAANRTTYRNPVCVRPLFRASPCFEKTQNKAFGFTLKRNQLVGVRRVATPIETTVFDLMARLQIDWQAEDEFAPTFFEGKRRRKNSKHNPHTERTHTAPRK